MNPNIYNGTPSKVRLLGTLSQILERPIDDYYDPDEISWVTDQIGITDVEGAKEAQLTGCYVVNVAKELMGNPYDDIDIPFEGMPTHLTKQMNAFADLVDLKLNSEENVRIVVHCAMGMERAPLAVVGYLIKYQSMTIDEAYELIVSKRPIACDRRLWMEKGVWSY